MPVLRFYRCPAAAAGKLAALARSANESAGAAASSDPIARVESEVVFYVEVAGDGTLTPARELAPRG
jgi:hypothetical protein